MSVPAPRTSPLADLGVTAPVLAAPMAGGPTTPALVAAAARSGGMGFLAAGYKTAEQLEKQVTEVRAVAPVFGVNLFAPNPVAVDPAAYRRYAEALRPLAERYGVTLPPEPVEDDDQWEQKLDLLRHDPVPVVSFTFGIPPHQVIAELKSHGSVVAQTVTNAAEARAAADAGVDMLAVQGWAAGAHSATLTPSRFPEAVPTAVLVAMIRDATPLPVIAAGGLATPAQVAEVINAGAQAVMVGTALLRTAESGASAAHQAAIADRSRNETVLTRSFSGRPARGIRNRFIDEYDAIAPSGYPALHHLTSPIRKAAAAVGDPEAVHLWAGTGYKQAAAGQAADVLRALAAAC
ncbi:MAG TPA: nitronate monooxygenase [Trebonia sp.]|jgi:NAD(P)H-dependent flavin oxidoreductase YrpB (nitropropane dioxygenase family)